MEGRRFCSFVFCWMPFQQYSSYKTAVSPSMFLCLPNYPFFENDWPGFHLKKMGGGTFSSSKNSDSLEPDLKSLNFIYFFDDWNHLKGRAFKSLRGRSFLRGKKRFNWRTLPVNCKNKETTPKRSQMPLPHATKQKTTTTNGLVLVLWHTGTQYNVFK